jgi:hypothetical protein
MTPEERMALRAEHAARVQAAREQVEAHLEHLRSICACLDRCLERTEPKEPESDADRT